MISPNEDTAGTPPSQQIVWPSDLQDSLVTGLADGLWIAIKKFNDHRKFHHEDAVLVKGLEGITQDPAIKEFIWSEFNKNYANFLILRDGGNFQEAKSLACYLALGRGLEYLENYAHEMGKLLQEFKKKHDMVKANKMG